MAVPFRKVSKTRKRMRRSHNALEVVGNKPHRVCSECGSYKGKKVVETKDAE